MPGQTRPTYTVIAGPNGAGKSTLFARLEAKGYPTGPFLNPDVIAARLRKDGAKPTSKIDVLAGKGTLESAREYFELKISFTRESTLSGNEVLNSMRRAKEHGFTVNLFYIGLSDRSLSVERVAHRVSLGGHDIPFDALMRRYEKSLFNAAKAIGLSDMTKFYDNSTALGYIPVADATNSGFTWVNPDYPVWFETILDSAR